MLRDAFYQPVGNPLQFDLLPDGQPTLGFAHKLVPLGKAKPHLVKAIQWMLGATFAAVVVKFIETVYGISQVVPASWALLAIGLFVAAGRSVAQQRRIWLAADAIVVFAAALIAWQADAPLTLAAGAVLASLTWHFARHGSYIATASPLPCDVAAQCRSKWNGFLIATLLGFIAAIAYALNLGSLPLLSGVVFGFPLVSIVFGIITVPCRGIGRIGLESLLSWAAYLAADVPIPGVAVSPTGRIKGRRWFTVATTFVVALAIFDLVSATGFYTPRKAIEWMVMAPLVTVWVPFGFAFPIFLEASRIRTTTVSAANWSPIIEQIASSPDPVEKDSLFIGNIVADGSPLLVPRAVFESHAHYLGDSGSGKTSMGLAPTTEQLVSRGNCSLIYVDLKADTTEPLAMLEHAVTVGRNLSGLPIPIKHFSNQPALSTFAFNPLTQKAWGKLPLGVKADLLTSAMGLQYGTDYGQGYYSTANTALLHEALKLSPNAKTFQELAEVLGDLAFNRAKGIDLHPEIRKAGIHVHEVVKRLASFEALNVAADDGHDPAIVQHQIELSDVFQQPQVLYFHLSSTLSPGASPEIARLMTNLLLVSSSPSERHVPVYLVLDEFQRMVANNVEAMLQLARSMGVGIILANQSLQDLKKSTTDLIPAVEANCRFRQWFSVSSLADRERLMAIGGQTVEFPTTRTESTSGMKTTTTVSTREEIQPRLGVNDISLTSDHPRRSIVWISRGDGYAQYGGLPVVIESNFHITAAEYERRKKFPWPTNVPGTFVPKLDSELPPPPPKKGPSITTETIE